MTSAVEEEQVTGPTNAAEVEERMVMPSSALGGDVLSSKVLIAPWGEVTSANGTFVMDEESARLVIEAFSAQGTDIPVDYEHQSLGGAYSSPTGQAPAAGWIRSLQAVTPGEAGEEEPGLFAEVTWTESARSKLVAKEYRYLSPVVVVRKRDRRVVALHSAALTNKPAIVGMKPIVNRQEPGRGEQIARDGAESKGKGCGGSPASRPGEEAVELLRLRLGLEVSSDVETVLLAAADRLASLVRDASQREARDKVESAMRAGKLTAAQQEWALSLAAKDPASFDEWAASAPVVVMTGRTEAPTTGGGLGKRDRAAVIASARVVFRSQPALAMLTSESAWIRGALREAGVELESA